MADDLSEAEALLFGSGGAASRAPATSLPPLVVEPDGTPSAAPSTELDEVAQLLGRKPVGGPAGPPKLPELKGLREGLRGTDMPEMRGANTFIANLLGLPVELANDALELASAGFLDKPGNAMQGMRDAFRKLGIEVNDRQADGIREKIGEEGVKQLLFMIGMRGMAPAMARNPTDLSKPVTQTVNGKEVAIQPTIREAGRAGVADMGRMAIEKPVTTAVTSIGAAPGIVAGGDLVEKAGGKTYGPMLRPIGEMGGGLLSALAAQGFVATLGYIPKGERGGYKPYSRPIMKDTDDPKYTKRFAEDQISRELEAVDKRVHAAVARVAAPENIEPARAARWLKDAIGRSHDAARAIEKEAWDRVKPPELINPTEILRVMDNVMTSSPLAQDQIPADRITDFTRAVLRHGPDGQVLVIAQPFDAIKKFRTALMKERQDAGGSLVTGKAPDRELMANLDLIEDAVMRAIDTSLEGSNNVAWHQARAISRAVNDRFARGPVGQLLGLDRQGAERVSPEDAMEFMLTKARGLRQVNDAAAGHLPPGPQQAGARPPSGPLQSEYSDAGKATRQGVDAAVRAEFVAAANRAIALENSLKPKPDVARAAGTAAHSFSKQVEGEIDTFTRTATTIRDTTQELLSLMGARRNWERSALAKYAEMDADKAIQRVMSAQDPARETADLVRSFNGDPAALAGFRRGVIEQFLRESGSAKGVVERLSLGKNRRMLSALLGDDLAERVQTNAISAAQIEGAGGFENRAQRLTAQAASFWAHSVGLWTGKGLHKLLGGGTAGALSYPQRMSKTMRNIVESYFERADPIEVLAASMLDPQTEAMLRNRMPGTIAEGARTASQLRRALVGMRMTYDRTVDAYLDKRMDEADPTSSAYVPRVPISR